MILKVQDLSFGYPCHAVLRGVSLEVDRGECLAVLGPNGVGKSTLLKCMDRILDRGGGRVVLAGTDVDSLSRNALARSMAYVAQSGTADRSTVFDAVLLGRRPYIRWEAGPKDLDAVERALALLDLTDFSMRYLDQLSGGELQKVLLARALAQEPDVLLMDEPTSSLDLKNQLETAALTRHIVRERNITAVVTMHDLNLALRLADKFLFLKDGAVYAAGDAGTVCPAHIRAVYGVDALVETVAGRPVVIPADPPVNPK